jgi:aspartate/methionine/tyrosine aminotransferase
MIETPPPRELVELLATASDGAHTYQARPGSAKMLAALRALWSVDESTGIFVSSGVSGAFVSLGKVLRDEAAAAGTLGGATQPFVVLAEPCYPYHARQLKSTYPEIELRYVRLDAIDAETLRGAAALVLTNPGNPTGRVIAADRMRTLVTASADAGALLVIDEIYHDLIYEPAPPASSPLALYPGAMPAHVLLFRGFSKSLGLQSWRLGAALGDPARIATLIAVHDPIYICGSFAQAALATFLARDDGAAFRAHSRRLARLLARNAALYGTVFGEALGWTAEPVQGAMYLMLRHTEASDEDAMIRALDAGVGVAPGSMFYGDAPANTQTVRIHTGSTAENADAIVSRLLRRVGATDARIAEVLAAHPHPTAA